MATLLNLKYRYVKLTPMDKDKQLYEIAYLIAPSMSEEEAQNFHQTVKNEAQGIGALIDDEGRVEKKRLRHLINKNTEAYLAYFRFTLESEKINDLEPKIKANKNILRHLTIKTKRHIQKAFSTSPFKPAEKPKDTLTPKEETPAANIEEIDKKLEEI